MVEPSCARVLLQSCTLPRLEARMLLEHVLKRPRAWLLAHDTDVLSADATTHFLALVQRRQTGEPMAYLVGHREFMGHRFNVRPGVLIPRPDTELLVETALAHVNAASKSGRACDVLDMGCGCGAIAISVSLACGARARVTGLDNSADALEVAVENVTALRADVRLVNSDWFDGLSETDTFDLIVSNPPYIAQDDPHLGQGDLRFEPLDALTDGADGLADIRALANGAICRLNAGGAIWIEHGWTQADAVRELLRQVGFQRVASLRDLAGIERISGGYL